MAHYTYPMEIIIRAIPDLDTPFRHSYSYTVNSDKEYDLMGRLALHLSVAKNVQRVQLYTYNFYDGEVLIGTMEKGRVVDGEA